MFFVVCYDIISDRRRYRVDKALSGYGLRVQKSVFETELNEKEFLKLRHTLHKEIDESEDSVRFYRQCVRCKSGVDVLGVGTVPTDEPEVIVV